MVLSAAQDYLIFGFGSRQLFAHLVHATKLSVRTRAEVGRRVCLGACVEFFIYPHVLILSHHSIMDAAPS